MYLREIKFLLIILLLVFLFLPVLSAGNLIEAEYREWKTMAASW